MTLLKRGYLLSRPHIAETGFTLFQFQAAVFVLMMKPSGLLLDSDWALAFVLLIPASAAHLLKPVEYTACLVRRTMLVFSDTML